MSTIYVNKGNADVFYDTRIKTKSYRV